MKKLFLLLTLTSASLFATAQIDSSHNKIATLIEEEAMPAYTKAQRDVTELRKAVSLAEKNLLPKPLVVKRFNDLVGNRLGKFSSFNAMVKKLEKEGDAYVNFKLKKEVSRIAREKAFESKFNVAELMASNY